MPVPLPEEVFNEIRSKYEASLIIPKERPIHQFFLCPVGLIGAGKTTVLKPLSQKLSLVRISGDDIRKMLHDYGYNYDQTWEMMRVIVESFARRGHSIANDGDCAPLRTREAIESLAHELGAMVVYVHVNPPEEFILNKLRTFKHTWLFRDGEHAVSNYLERKPLHENLSLPYVFTFDTSRSDLFAQIDAAEKAIRTHTGN